jgi:peptidoglycan/LPS O-acetylase OafA/YrhL
LNVKGESVFYTWQNSIHNIIYIPKGELIPEFWSLSHEVIFYILAPSVLFKKQYGNIFIIVIAVLYLSSFIFVQNEHAGTYVIDRFFFDYSVFFVMGTLLYRAVSKDLFTAWITGKGKLILSVIILFPLMVFLKYELGEENRITPLYLRCSLFL